MRPGRALALALVVGALGCGGWILAPGPIDPEAWTPPPDPGPPTASTLPEITVARPAPADGAEDVEVDAEGRIYAGTQDGTIWRWASAEAEPEAFVRTGGRPLGLTRAPTGELLVADAFRGLLSVTPEGRIEVLTTTCGDRPMVFTDDLEVTADGRIWFTDASQRFDQHHWKPDLVENRPTGRLCLYDPSRPGRAEEVLDGLAFANGVAIDPEGRFVLVAETARYRIRRYWLTGAHAGEADVLVDGLPGFPDGISQGTGGVFWIALASPRNAALDATAGLPLARKLIARLPEALGPKPARLTRVIGVDAEGRVVHDLVDPEGVAYTVVTSVEERGDRLLLGSLAEHAWASIARPR